MIIYIYIYIYNDNNNNNNIPSLWRDKRPAIKGLRPPERRAGHLPPDQERLLRVQHEMKANFCFDVETQDL